MKETENQLWVNSDVTRGEVADPLLCASLTPTLNAPWLATRMVDIIESGLSDHLVAPNFAALLLPSLRSGPEWFRYLVNTVRPSLFASRARPDSMVFPDWQDTRDHHRRRKRCPAQSVHDCRSARCTARPCVERVASSGSRATPHVMIQQACPVASSNTVTLHLLWMPSSLLASHFQCHCAHACATVEREGRAAELQPRKTHSKVRG